MQLSKHFTLEEMTRSMVASRKGIDNIPGAGEIKNLEKGIALPMLLNVTKHGIIANRHYTIQCYSNTKSQVQSALNDLNSFGPRRPVCY